MENWKVIVEYPSYSISSLGRVKNNTTNKVLKAVPNTFGYLQVRLYKEGQYKVFTIHQLVAAYFLPIPSGDLELNHIDEDKLNNRPRKCLNWKTPYEVFYGEIVHLI